MLQVLINGISINGMFLWGGELILRYYPGKVVALHSCVSDIVPPGKYGSSVYILRYVGIRFVFCCLLHNYTIMVGKGVRTTSL